MYKDLLPVTQTRFGFLDRLGHLEDEDYLDWTEEEISEWSDAVALDITSTAHCVQTLINSLGKLEVVRPKDSELMDLHIHSTALARGNAIVTGQVLDVITYATTDDTEKVEVARRKVIDYSGTLNRARTELTANLWTLRNDNPALLDALGLPDYMMSIIEWEPRKLLGPLA